MLNLSVSLLGRFVATIDHEPLPPFRTRSEQALLIYLLWEAERPHVREQIAYLQGQNCLLILDNCEHLIDAAVPARLLPMAEIGARLDHRFRLLTGGSLTALPR